MLNCITLALFGYHEAIPQPHSPVGDMILSVNKVNVVIPGFWQNGLWWKHCNILGASLQWTGRVPVRILLASDIWIASMTHVQPVFAVVWLCTFLTASCFWLDAQSHYLQWVWPLKRLCLTCWLDKSQQLGRAQRFEGYPCATLMHRIYPSPFFMWDSFSAKT